MSAHNKPTQAKEMDNNKQPTNQHHNKKKKKIKNKNFCEK